MPLSLESNLSNCFLLKELPSSICKLINLEELSLNGCTGLRELRGCSSLEKLCGCSSLKTLDLSKTAIWEVPSSINSNWPCLYSLDMSNCRNLNEFPNVPDSIVELVLSQTGIEEIPPRIEKLSRLRKLNMYGCKKLKKISPNISKLENLEFLDLYCSSEDGIYSNPELFDARIELVSLLSDFTTATDFSLPEISLRLGGDFKTIPDFIRRFSSRLRSLDIFNCSMLVALPWLARSLEYINAQGCTSLKRIDSSLLNSRKKSLNFSGCLNLNQKARKLIQTSDCKYALVPGEEVPAHFPYRASSGSLTINLTQFPLPPSFRFKACILLSKGGSFQDEILIRHSVYCSVSGKRNGLTIHDESELHGMECRYAGSDDHLFIFEDSFCVYKDVPEAKKASFSELVFKFTVDSEIWKAKGCGVRILPAHCFIDEIENDFDGDQDESDDDDEGSDCLNLIQKVGKPIQKSDCESMLVPGLEVPAHFTNRGTSGSIRIISPTSFLLPSSFRFKACILLSRPNMYNWDRYELADAEDDDNLVMSVSCRFWGKKPGLVLYGSKNHDMPYLYGDEDRLYTFEDSFCLNQDCPEAKKATFKEREFQFDVCYKYWRVKAYGVELLEDLYCFVGGKETGDNEQSGQSKKRSSISKYWKFS